jgi:hypothetical protein
LEKQISRESRETQIKTFRFDLRISRSFAAELPSVPQSIFSVNVDHHWGGAGIYACGILR